MVKEDRTQTIVLPIVPPTATAQQKGVFVRNGHAHFYTKSKIRNVEVFIGQLLMPYRPRSPHSGPVRLEITWNFPFRKKEKRSVVKAGLPVYHTSRPDLDNLEKMLLDVLTKLSFWTDDSLIAEKLTSKRWALNPSIKIVIRDLADPVTTATSTPADRI